MAKEMAKALRIILSVLIIPPEKKIPLLCCVAMSMKHNNSLIVLLQNGKDRSGIHQSLEQVQRTGVIPLPRRELSVDTTKLADNLLQNKRETECLENKQGLKEQQAENILTNRHKEIIIKNNQKQSKMITNNQKLSNLIKKEQHDDRTGTHTQENSALLAAGTATNTNQPTNTTHSKVKNQEIGR